MPRLDSDKVTEMRDPIKRREYIDKVADGCSADDPIQLSDPIANKERWGGSVLRALGMLAYNAALQSEEQMKWKLQVLRDEWGNTLGPGDTVSKWTQKSLMDKKGQPIDPKLLSTAKMDGSYKRRFMTEKKFTVDKKGCIECNFEDAVHFCHIWGVHSETGMTLFPKPEMSNEPLNTPNGQKLHCHYWRFKEVTREQYKQLKDIPERKEPLRGLDKMEKIQRHMDDEKIKKEVADEQHKQQVLKEAKKGNNNQ